MQDWCWNPRWIDAEIDIRIDARFDTWIMRYTILSNFLKFHQIFHLWWIDLTNFKNWEISLEFWEMSSNFSGISRVVEFHTNFPWISGFEVPDVLTQIHCIDVNYFHLYIIYLGKTLHVAWEWEIWQSDWLKKLQKWLVEIRIEINTSQASLKPAYVDNTGNKLKSAPLECLFPVFPASWLYFANFRLYLKIKCSIFLRIRQAIQ